MFAPINRSRQPKEKAPLAGQNAEPRRTIFINQNKKGVQKYKIKPTI